MIRPMISMGILVRVVMTAVRPTADAVTTMTSQRASSVVHAAAGHLAVVTIRPPMQLVKLARLCMTAIRHIAIILVTTTTTISRRASSAARAAAAPSRQLVRRRRSRRRRLRHRPHLRRRPIRPARTMIRPRIPMITLVRRGMTKTLTSAESWTMTISRRASSAARAAVVLLGARMARLRRLRRRRSPA